MRVVRALVFMGLLFSLGTTGCATKLFGAEQVGGAENATWVFVHTDDNVNGNGVYRCRDDGASVTCRKARIVQ